LASPISNSGSGTPGRKRVEPGRTKTHTTTVAADIPSEPQQPAEGPLLAQDDPLTSQERLSPATPSSDFSPDFRDQGTESSHPSESEGGYFRHSTEIARLEPSTKPQIPSSGSCSSVIVSSLSTSPQSPVSVQATNHSTHMFISNESTDATSSASSSVFVLSRTVNVSGINRSSSTHLLNPQSRPSPLLMPHIPPPSPHPKSTPRPLHRLRTCTQACRSIARS